MSDECSYCEVDEDGKCEDECNCDNCLESRAEQRAEGMAETFDL